MSKDGAILEVNNLCKYFPLGKNKILKAVDGVNFTLNKKEVLGVVGESGCGKTTLGRTILFLTPPTSGEVIFEGIKFHELSKEELRKMRKKMQIVFQDPYSSLNPRMTIGNTLTHPMIIQGLYKGGEKKRARFLLDQVGLDSSAMNRYPHEFSGGQLQRIGLARTLSVDPELIIADEPVSALDVSVQSQVLNLIKDLQEEFSLTMMFIAHDLSVVEFISDHIAVLYLGKIVEKSPSQLLYQAPKHPYTKFLLSSVPLPDPEVEQSKVFQSLEGEIPTPINPLPKCRFLSRCPEKIDICQEVEPDLVEVEKDHFVACLLFKDQSIHDE